MGQAIAITDYILSLTGLNPIFFISATGDLNIATTLQLGENSNMPNSKNNAAKAALDGKCIIRVEASLTVDAGFIGFLFTGFEKKAHIANNVYKAYAETGITGSLGSGVDAAGLYIEAYLAFAGLQFVAEKRTEDEDEGTERTIKNKKSYTAVEPRTLLGGKYYFDLNQNT